MKPRSNVLAVMRVLVAALALGLGCAERRPAGGLPDATADVDRDAGSESADTTSDATAAGCDAAAHRVEDTIDPVSGRCHGPLGSGGCTPTWGDAEIGTSTCDERKTAQTFAVQSGDYLLRGTIFTLGGSICVYDAATRELAGEWNRVDVTSFCCGRDFVRFTGDLPPAVIASLNARSQDGPSCTVDAGFDSPEGG